MVSHLQFIDETRLTRVFFPQEAASIDSDIRSKYSQYNQIKNTLATLQRKQTYVTLYLLCLR